MKVFLLVEFCIESVDEKSHNFIALSGKGKLFLEPIGCAF